MTTNFHLLLAACSLPFAGGCASTVEAAPEPQWNLSRRLLSREGAIKFGTSLTALPVKDASTGQSHLLVGLGGDDGAPGSLAKFVLETNELVFRVDGDPCSTFSRFPHGVTVLTDLTGDGVAEFACGSISSDWLNGVPPNRLLVLDGRSGDRVVSLSGDPSRNDGFGAAAAAVPSSESTSSDDLVVLVPWATQGNTPAAEVRTYSTTTWELRSTLRLFDDSRMASRCLVGLASAAGARFRSVAAVGVHEKGERAVPFSVVDLDTGARRVVSLELRDAGVHFVDHLILGSDVDGDGHREVILGAQVIRPKHFNSGVVLCVSPTTGRILWQASIDAPRSVTSLAEFPDVDGDGNNDIVVGSPSGDQASRGSVLILRSADGSTAMQIQPEHATFTFGVAVAVMPRSGAERTNVATLAISDPRFHDGTPDSPHWGCIQSVEIKLSED